MKFVFIEIDEQCYIITADNKHIAIEKYVNKKHNGDMSDFYYGMDDGQISIYTVTEEIE